MFFHSCQMLLSSYCEYILFLFLRMSKHIKTGSLGEQLAVQYFEHLGYDILHKNWRHSHWEIDIIATKNNGLHFIEVKTKSSIKYGYPEETVSKKKIKNMINASEFYLFLSPQWQKIQFDILSITLKPTITYFLIEDVFI